MNEVNAEKNTEKAYVLAAEAGKLGVKKEVKKPVEGEVQVVQSDDSADKPVNLN